jgi:hypothetical protein
MFTKKKSLESILSTFTKTVEDLGVLQEFNFRDIENNTKSIDALTAINNRLRTENERAAKVEEKINSLLS